MTFKGLLVSLSRPGVSFFFSPAPFLLYPRICRISFGARALLLHFFSSMELQWAREREESMMSARICFFNFHQDVFLSSLGLWLAFANALDTLWVKRMDGREMDGIEIYGYKRISLWFLGLMLMLWYFLCICIIVIDTFILMVSSILIKWMIFYTL